jgi:hypothetical protein
MGRLVIEKFDGGLNTRDSVNSLSIRETPEAINFRVEERGALGLRKGVFNFSDLPGDSGQKAHIFFSPTLNKWFCIRQKTSPANMTLYWKAADLSGSWTSLGNLLTDGNSGGAVSWADWPGTTPYMFLSIGHQNGGVWFYDGTTLTKEGGLTGGISSLQVWQNRLWGCGYFDTTTPGKFKTRLVASKIGDPTLWSPAAGGLQVEIRDKDAEPLMTMGIASGALIIFKRRSAYRVNNSDTGAYTTIDPAVGSKGYRSIISLHGGIYTWGEGGIYAWDGNGPGVNIGDKVKPTIEFNTSQEIAAGEYNGNAIFTYPENGSSVNNAYLEIDPVQGWIMKHKFPNSAKDDVHSLANKNEELWAAIRDGDDLVRMFWNTEGSDDNSIFSGTYRTPWIQPEGGRNCHLQKIEIGASIDYLGVQTTLKFRVYKNFDRSSYDEYDITAAALAGDAGDERENIVLQSLGHSKAFAFEFVTGTDGGKVTIRSLIIETTPIER